MVYFCIQNMWSIIVSQKLCPLDRLADSADVCRQMIRFCFLISSAKHFRRSVWFWYEFKSLTKLRPFTATTDKSTVCLYVEITYIEYSLALIEHITINWEKEAICWRVSNWRLLLSMRIAHIINTSQVWEDKIFFKLLFIVQLLENFHHLFM